MNLWLGLVFAAHFDPEIEAAATATAAGNRSFAASWTTRRRQASGGHAAGANAVFSRTLTAAGIRAH